MKKFLFLINVLVITTVNSAILNINRHPIFNRSFELNCNGICPLFGPKVAAAFFQKIIHNSHLEILRENRVLCDKHLVLAKEYSPKALDQICKENPFFLLHDCMVQQCPLNRLLHPEERLECNDKIASDLIQNFNACEELTITIFTPGGMLSELIVLTKIINTCACKKIRFVLIDNLYEPCKTFIQKASHSDSLTMTDIRNPQVRIDMLRMAQFIHWLTFLKPQTTVTFNFYSHCDDYIKDCINTPTLQSGAILAMDYYDGEFGEWAEFDLQNLFVFGLKVGGMSYSYGMDAKRYMTQQFNHYIVNISQKIAEPEDNELFYKKYTQTLHISPQFLKELLESFEKTCRTMFCKFVEV